ncbi:hypothetical protein F4694_005818 [Bacillus niacini]|uniref:Uncharacterized protein n=1 Tax=Neobacillus niacini TaxID=86668 RepID=A0A852TLC3_9BACI|nr:hypothetical protein [Neobacillus niacini]
MQWNWDTVLLVQLLIWFIVLFERKQLKNASKADRITFAVILFLSTLSSFHNLENLQGPITFLKYILGPLGRMME